jgi:hypothetical protein
MRSSHSRRNSDDIPLYAQCGVASGAMFTRRDEVTAQLEVIVDPAMIG